MPSARTRGTVTGPVVTAPQSQASARTGSRAGMVAANADRPRVPARRRKMKGLSDHPWSARRMPRRAAAPTPRPTQTTSHSL